MNLLAYVVYMLHLRGLCVADTYLALMGGECVEVGCVLVDVYKNVGSICPSRTMAVWITSATKQPYLSSDMPKHVL